MTKKSIRQLLTIMVTVIALQACNQNNKAKKEVNGEQVKEIAHADYQCPMECEKGKVYHEPGKCPVCEMELAKVEHTESEKHEHDTATTTHPEHEGHEHKEGEKHEHKEGDGHKH